MRTRHGQLVNLHRDLGGGPIDIFIGSASFERRSLSVPTNLEGGRVEKVVIGVNLTYLDAVKRHFEEMRIHFGSRVEKLELFAEDPVKSAGNISACVGASLTGPPKRMVVDITTFTRETLLMLLDCLVRRKRSGDDVLLVYAHAEEYSVGAAAENKWLSRGIRDVRSVLGFPGIMAPSRPTHLIVMVGFEDERTVDLVEICEPSFVSLGVADEEEGGAKPHQLTHVGRVQRLRKHLHGRLRGVETFTFRAYDAWATASALARQSQVFGGCNVVLVPMNTKISTVGALLFAHGDEAVQICYAPANTYNMERYSEPGADYYVFSPWVGSETST